MFIITVFANGWDNGDTDRRGDYKSLIKHHMSCENQLVLSPLADKFLTVTPDGVRHVSDKDCKVLFSFTKLKTYRRTDDESEISVFYHDITALLAKSTTSK